ncbi:hypothetical protein P3L10_004568 [Capsicum annuum]
MLIEVNVTKDLPNEVLVMEPNGRKFKQSVIYDWKPTFCSYCKVVGHSCLPNPKEQGKPKEPYKKMEQECPCKRKITIAQAPTVVDNTTGKEVEVTKVLEVGESSGTRHHAPQNSSIQPQHSPNRQRSNSPLPPIRDISKPTYAYNLSDFPQ